MEHRKQPEVPIKGIHISRMNIAIILASCVLYILLSITAGHFSKTFQDTYATMEELFTCSQVETLLYTSTSYLTEQTRLYVVTGDPTYLDNYFQELDRVQERAFALEAIMQFDRNNKAQDYFQAATQESGALSKQEIYAMALVSTAQGVDFSTLPEAVGQAELTEEDRALSPEEQMAKARDIVFSSAYQEAKVRIEDDVYYSLDSLYSTIEQRMADSYGNLNAAMKNHQLLIGIHFTATLIGFAFTLLLVVLPMWSCVKSIKEKKVMRAAGAYECKCLARTYNAMLERNVTQESMLRHQVEHDALTGLLNRGAFDGLQQSLHAQNIPLTLLLVDVDKFKQVNDGYGHETGDKVLKKVAKLLAQHFRSTDFPARIGGDEFAVIVMDTDPNPEQAIMEKIGAINEILTHPDDGLPVVSLSVGGAVSKEGFSDNLYKNADLALYEVKEHGRCGCRFYSQIAGKAPK